MNKEIKDEMKKKNKIPNKKGTNWRKVEKF